MENVLTITNLKQNILEFNAGLEGLDDNEMRVRLIIEANGMDLGFDAKRIQGTLWEVVIPPLPMLEKTAYPFRMDVVAEGYFFAPLKGTMNVVGTHELYVTDPKNRNIPPKEIEGLPKKHVVKPEGSKEVEDSPDKVAPKVLKPEPTKMDAKKEINIADVAKRLQAMAGKTEQPKPPVKEPLEKEADKKEVEAVIDAERKEEKKEEKAPLVKRPVKKLEVGGKKPMQGEEGEEKKDLNIDDIVERAKKKAREAVVAPKEEKPEEKKEEVKAEPVEDKKEEVKKEEPKPEPKKEEPKKEEKVEAKPEPTKKEEEKDEEKKEEKKSSTFEEALEKVSKPIPKKKRVPKKMASKPKAGTIKKITEDKEIISKPEEEVELEAKKEEAVKDILSESKEETKKVVTQPIKKKGKITYH